MTDSPAPIIPPACAICGNPTRRYSASVMRNRSGQSEWMETCSQKCAIQNGQKKRRERERREEHADFSRLCHIPEAIESARYLLRLMSPKAVAVITLTIGREGAREDGFDIEFGVPVDTQEDGEGEGNARS